MNLYPYVPLGISGEYQFEYSTESTSGSAESDTRHNLLAGVHYTGRRDLQLGLNFAVSLISETITTSSTSATFTETDLSGAFDLIYYF